MSFILEAIKKSENKRRGKSANQSSPSIHELTSQNTVRSRFWFLGIVIVLSLNIVLLVWFFNPWKPLTPTTAEPLIVAPGQQQEMLQESASVQMSPAIPQRNSTAVAVAPPSPAHESQDSPTVTGLHVPRSEKQIYRFNQLPLSIQQQIPELHMSLHAFNRDDATASMVQLNDRMMREKDMVSADISIEQITSAGVVLQYDGYRFLLPKRGN
ncbi:Type II secretion system protein B [Desulfuromusa kysingii]|uniref:Type II secretion system protein B n=1 Tax=Desulfuromusa kysingii TaxID=37625 RepID=A0A1H3XJA4_9BACT|nr:general secretion pathway protein GspB [Desulfuromusa kysingii]SDZ98724.1 Type II secretion system protein B [Desulfuromusa kysingii]